jgi:undecaprenyl-diphosphatase
VELVGRGASITDPSSSLSVLEGLVLGLVQGFTEFLPVSSSGHLLLAQELMDVHEPGVLLEVLVHLATSGSVMVYYRRDLATLLRETISGGPGRSEALRIVVASIPVAVAYVVFGKFFEHALESAVVAAACLCVTGVVLLASSRARPREDFTQGVGHALIVGCAQAIAILPGISRSGSTITAALFTGDDAARAARFSFLMSLPVILGAGGLKGIGLVTGDEVLPPDSTPFLVAAVFAFVSGLAAIHALVLLVSKRRLSVFGPYCLLVGAGFLVWFAVR